MSENSDGLNVPLGRTVAKLIAVIVVLGIGYMLRPLFHPIVYGVAYSPALLYSIGIPVIVGTILFVLPPLDFNKTKAISGVFVVCLLVGIVWGGAGAIIDDRTMAYDMMENSEKIEKLPETNADNPRIVPKDVADIQTRGSTSYRQYTLGESSIARGPDGNLNWAYPIEPDQFQNQLRGNQQGVLLSDMTTMEDRDMIAEDNKTFKHGKNMLLYRSSDWQVKLGDYNSAYYDEPIPFMHDGDAYMVYPKTGHEWHLGLIPHTTPTWKGVALVHQDGQIEHLNREEAQESEILDGQRLYPLHNAQVYSESLNMRNGFWNQVMLIGTFEGVVEPADLPRDTGNSQPFTVDLSDNTMSLMYAMEPTGENSRGLDEVWLYNAETGERQYYRSGDKTLLGPERAMDIVRSEDTQTQWNKFKVVEPVPTVIEGKLWWHTKVVANDFSDVSHNGFVNAESQEVVLIESTESVTQLIAGEDMSNIDDIANGSVSQEEADSSDSDADYYVVIRDSEGNVVDRIPIQDNQDFDIEVAD